MRGLPSFSLTSVPRLSLVTCKFFIDVDQDRAATVRLNRKQCIGEQSMRISLISALSCALAMPALAGVEEDFALANRVFGQTSATAVLDDIDGEWLPLSLLADTGGGEPAPGLVSSMLERMCGLDPVRGWVIEATGDTSFTLVVPGRGPGLTYRFDWTSGAQFLRSFDPQTLFMSRGLDTLEGEKGDEARANALRQSEPHVNIHRVSADMLVMATSQRADILGRCSAQ